MHEDRIRRVRPGSRRPPTAPSSHSTPTFPPIASASGSKAARARQRAARGGSAASRWRPDGQPMQRASRMAWLPWPGHHTLELVDAKGVAVDTVKFEVRGAFARKAAAY